MSPAADGRSRTDRERRLKARSKVAEAIGQRAGTDALIRGWWSFLPLVAVAAGLVGLVAFVLIIGGIEGAVFGYVVMLMVGFAFLAILNYKMTRRLSEHMRREALLREGLTEYLRAVTDESGQSPALVEKISVMEVENERARAEERLPNPIYAAMAALPLVGLILGYYYLYHMSRVTAPHDQRWVDLVGASSAMSGLELALSSPTAITMRRHSFPLYAALSLLLFPFLAYWYHLMLEETNAHFEAQWRTEDQILSALR